MQSLMKFRKCLESRKKKVVDIMMALFDEQEIREMRENSIKAESENIGILKSIKKLLLNGGTEEMARNLLDATDEQISMAKKL